MKRATVDPILRLVSQVHARERLRDAVVGLSTVALPSGLVLAALAVASNRLFDVPLAATWVAALPVPVVVAFALFRRRSGRAAARRIDAHYGLQDRLGSALELSQPGVKVGTEDPRARALAEVAVEEGLRSLRGLRAGPVIPISVPPPRLLDGLCVLLLASVFLLPRIQWSEDEVVRADGTASTEDTAVATKAGLDLTMAEPLRGELRMLTEGDDAPAKVATELLDVLDALEKGEIDRATALARLESLDQELLDAEIEMEAATEEDPWIMGEGVRQLAEALREHEITEDVAEALSKGDADDAEKKLEEAMAKAEAEAEAGRQETQQALDKALSDAEKALGKAANKDSKTAAELAEAERRLKQQEKRPAEDPKEQERRLKQQKKRVEELKRQHEREKAAQRKLDQLRREAQQSRSSQNRDGSKRKDNQSKLGKGVGQATRKSGQSRRMSGARDALEEAKAFVRRAGSQGEKEQRRKDQAQRFGKAAKGQKGKGEKGKPSLLVEGKVGEGGEPMGMMEGEGEGEGQGEGEGEGQGEGEGEGEGEGQGEGEGEGQGQSDGEGGQQSGGDGIGQGSVDPLGEASERDVKHRDLKVDAKAGRGATRAEIIETASQEGFAQESYQRVYRDYRGFAQSAMDNEEIPDAQRRRVKRYFQMIQPRD